MQLNQCLTGNLEIIGDCLSFVYNLVIGYSKPTLTDKQ